MLADYESVVRNEQAWVAEGNGRIVGLLVLRFEHGFVLLDNVAVAPEVQRVGIGSALVAVAEDQGRQAGLSEVRLYTNVAMIENLSYYLHHGYQRNPPSRSGRLPTGLLLQVDQHAIAVEGSSSAQANGRRVARSATAACWPTSVDASVDRDHLVVDVGVPLRDPDDCTQCFLGYSGISGGDGPRGRSSADESGRRARSTVTTSGVYREGEARAGE
jgi:hypothetical protein